MGNLLQYSNGWGHLIMSLYLGTLGAVLIILPQTDSAIKGIGVGLIMTVSGAWFIPGAAKQVAYQVQKNVAESLPQVVESLPIQPVSPEPVSPEPASPEQPAMPGNMLDTTPDQSTAVTPIVTPGVSNATGNTGNSTTDKTAHA